MNFRTYLKLNCMGKKFLFFGLLFSLLLSVEAKPKKVKLNTANDSASYAMGVEFAKNIRDNVKNFPGGPFNWDLLINGMNSVLTNDTVNLLMPQSTTADYFQNYAIKASEREALKNKKEGELFLENNKKAPNVKVTASGLQYKVIKEGNDVKPSGVDKVKVHYRGTLLDGTVFDSSYERGQPLEFELKNVIKGWTEGLQLMGVGAKYILYIPYDLAYGARGNGSIKPYSTLIFEVELLDVAKAPVNTIKGAKYQFPEYQRTIK